MFLQKKVNFQSESIVAFKLYSQVVSHFIFGNHVRVSTQCSHRCAKIHTGLAAGRIKVFFWLFKVVLPVALWLYSMAFEFIVKCFPKEVQSFAHVKNFALMTRKALLNQMRFNSV